MAYIISTQLKTFRKTHNGNAAHCVGVCLVAMVIVVITYWNGIIDIRFVSNIENCLMQENGDIGNQC